MEAEEDEPRVFAPDSGGGVDDLNESGEGADVEAPDVDVSAGADIDRRPREAAGLGDLRPLVEP